MLTGAPLLICDSNLSHAWARAFTLVMEGSKTSRCPLLLSIDGFRDNLPQEDLSIRQELDRSLALHGKYSSAVSGSVIFPFNQWERAGRPPSSRLFPWYLNEFLPRLKARDALNRNGTYFERMIAFQGAKRVGAKTEISTKNQLEQIILQWRRDQKKRRRPRQSALQVSCFDPPKDHTGQSMRGFPCLQQVGFAYDDMGGLSITALYPTQYIFDRAYGNYLGLCHLGSFMAHELGAQLVRLNVLVSYPELGSPAKSALKRLKNLVQDLVDAGTIQHP